MPNDDEKELEKVSLYKLAKGKYGENKESNENQFVTFHIPYYQRGYRWTADNITTLLDDLLIFINNDNSQDYYMQPLAIKFDKSNNQQIVVDGQQRLTTFYLIYLYLKTKDLWKSDLKNFNEEWKKKVNELKWYKIDYDNKNANDILLNPMKLIPIVSDEKNKEQIEARKEAIASINNINEFYIWNAYSYIKDWFKNDSNKENVFEKLFEDNIDKKRIRFLIYPVEQQDEHDVFLNINSGKIPLSNADLIKALLLVESSGLKRREQIAAVYETMQRQFQDNRFWYMFNFEDVREEKGQTRIDYLFNLVEKISDEEYQNDTRAAFYKMSKSNNLEDKWIEVEKDFQILLEFYKNPEYYHYIGYLVFANNSNKVIKELIDEYKTKTKSNFLQESLTKRIKDLFVGKTLSDYVYYPTSDGKKKTSNKDFQKLFVLHNIETILIRYRELSNISITDKSKKMLQLNMFEYFPFDLFYNNDSWDIEHISSQTTNDLVSDDDKREWIQSALGECSQEELDSLNKKYKLDSDNLKNILSNENDYYSLLEELKRILNLNDNGLENNVQLKNYLGNLVLLDANTNRSFHNSIFSQKRRMVLKSSVILSNEKDDKTKIKYIPPCTKDVYTKAYSNSKSLGFLNWTVEDARDYVEDIAKKLKSFIDKGELPND